jgi:ABC-type lipoprotein export system ATPase subunit
MLLAKSDRLTGRSEAAASGTAAAPRVAHFRLAQTPLIRLLGVSKTYAVGEVEVPALRGVSLDIESGEYVALMGPSGSGKTTLMNTLGCLDRPTEGRYLLEGKDVAQMSGDERARLRNQKIGFVFQNFNLLARTTALENVELPLLYCRKLRGRQRRERAGQLLRKVDLESRTGHRPSQLSGGQQQRVAIARALVNRPPILLADEPTGNIDSRTSREVMDLFRQLNEEDRITIILVTHDQDVARHARRTVVLRDGRIICDATDFARAEAVLHQPDETSP